MLVLKPPAQRKTTKRASGCPRHRQQITEPRAMKDVVEPAPGGHAVDVAGGVHCRQVAHVVVAPDGHKDFLDDVLDGALIVEHWVGEARPYARRPYRS